MACMGEGVEIKSEKVVWWKLKIEEVKAKGMGILSKLIERSKGRVISKDISGQSLDV